MELIAHEIEGRKIVEVHTQEPLLNSVQNAIDLIGNLYYQGVDKIVLYKSDVHTEFFDLKTKLAGEILQKFSNYRMQLAIVGDYSELNSKSWNDFMLESNKGNLVHFAAHLDEVIEHTKAGR